MIHRKEEGQVNDSPLFILKKRISQLSLNVRLAVRRNPNRDSKFLTAHKTDRGSRSMGSWFVYILECNDGSYYTGITRDLDKRVDEHKNGTGARYTKMKGVKQLLWSMSCDNRSTASKHEAKIKSLSRPQKKLLILQAESRRYCD